jgi:hypothetical protein
MAKTGNIPPKPSEPPKKVDETAKKPKRLRDLDDEDDDGDFATPKRDREGNDDEPL